MRESGGMQQVCIMTMPQGLGAPWVGMQPGARLPLAVTITHTMWSGWPGCHMQPAAHLEARGSMILLT